LGFKKNKKKLLQFLQTPDKLKTPRANSLRKNSFGRK